MQEKRYLPMALRAVSDAAFKPVIQNFSGGISEMLSLILTEKF